MSKRMRFLALCAALCVVLHMPGFALGTLYSETDSVYTFETDEAAEVEEPAKIPWLDGALPMVTGGGTYTLFVDSGHTLYACGGNSYGQLGDGTLRDSSVPVKVMDDVAMAFRGDVHSLAVTTDGRLYAWGSNRGGMLGFDGDNSSVPRFVMDHVTQASGGYGFTMALTTEGEVYTWGSNSFGQLGDGTMVTRSSPVKVMDNAVRISAGGSYACAIQADGSLYTWGDNSCGQYGHPGLSESLSPVAVPLFQ